MTKIDSNIVAEDILRAIQAEGVLISESLLPTLMASIASRVGIVQDRWQKHHDMVAKWWTDDRDRLNFMELHRSFVDSEWSHGAPIRSAIDGAMWLKGEKAK